jgi:2-hydroxycyclohexanecarboxyl-CoA dehydrogenase
MPDSQFTAKQFNESNALIIGGTAGTGLESARQLLAAGVKNVVIVGRNAERGERAATELGGSGRVIYMMGNAVDPDEAESLAAAAHKAMGSIDILVCSTTPEGILPELLFKMSPARVREILNRCALPPLLMSATVMPFMRAQRSGSIINIASDAGKFPTVGESVIGGAMAAITMFSRGAAMEAKRDGIRVNAITPSFIAGSAAYDHAMAQPLGRKVVEKAVKMAGLGVTDASDIAALVTFLAGPQSAKLTGQVISLNGGISAA